MIKIRSGDWKALFPVAEELLEHPELIGQVRFEWYNEYTGTVGFHYKGCWVEIGAGYIRVADRRGLHFKSLLVLEDTRVRQLRRRIKKALAVGVRA